MDLVIELKTCCEARLDLIRRKTRLSAAEHACLRAMPEDGVVGAGELAVRMGLSPSRASRIIEKMVGRKLLRRNVSSSDRRVSELSLSARGRELKTRTRGCIDECERSLRDRLTPGQIARAVDVLTVLTRELKS